MAELPLLRRAVGDVPTGAVARRMVSAARPHGARFRIAVAGLDGADLGRIDVGFADAARGVATSGWGGRSFSLGIADAVTVLARSVAEADVAATMICNAVDLPGHVAVGRAPADSLQPESDLGVRLVTVSVDALSLGEVAEALARGAAVAEDLCGRGLAVSAALFLKGQARMVGLPALTLIPDGSLCGARRYCAIVRKIATVVEEIFHEGWPVSATPPKRGAIMAVISNPFAGWYVENLQPFMQDMKPLGLMMGQRLLAVLGGDASAIEGYGKATLVGRAGELEHGALWHAPGGYAMREVLGGAKAIVPSAKKVGAVGARWDVPITHVNAAYVRSHFDAIEVGLNDAPRAGEIMVAVTDGGRSLARVGGLTHEAAEGKDGLR